MNKTITKKTILLTGLLFLFISCTINNHSKHPDGIPKEAKFDRKKNIFTLTKDRHEYVWYESGKLYADCGINEMGVHNGECRYFSEMSGSILSQGNHVNSLKDGLWYWYFPNGTVYYKQNFNHAKRRTDFWIETNQLGNEHGVYERFYISGQLEERGEYDTGYKSGKWEKYYKSGKLEYVGSYLKDKKIGNWKFYYPDGTLEAEENFDSNTNFLSRVTYLPDGNVNCKNIKDKTLECR